MLIIPYSPRYANNFFEKKYKISQTLLNSDRINVCIRHTLP